MAISWLLFTYKVPNEPSARRVYVWRRLKSLGALLIQDAVWVLPAAEAAREKLRWLAAEVCEMPGGEASLWEAQQIFTGRGNGLIEQFNAQADALYQPILNALADDDPDLTALARQYQHAQRMDYFGSPLADQTREALLKRREGDTP